MRRNLILSVVSLAALVFLFQNCAETSFSSRSQPTQNRANNVQPEQFEIMYAPQDQSINLGSQARFEVGVAGPGFVTFEWSKDGLRLDGQTENLIDIFDAKLTDAGVYTVDVFLDGQLFSSLSANLEVVAQCTQGDKQSCTVGGKAGSQTCGADGSWGTCVATPVDPCKGYKKPAKKVYSSPGTRTYTVPKCVKKIRVTVVGGGGGGSRSTRTCAYHHFSGSGGAGVIADVDVKGGQKIKFSVGRGGAKGTAKGAKKGSCGARKGKDGGDSYFGGYVKARGGDGGGVKHYKVSHRILSKGGTYSISKARKIKAGKGQSKGISGGCGGKSGLGDRGSCSAGSKAKSGGGGYGSGRQYMNGKASDGGHGRVEIQVIQ